MDVTRRNLIHILGLAPAAAVAQTQAAQTPAEHAHAAPPAPAKKAYQRKIFNDHQWRAVQVLCDLIIPADERSGSATAAVAQTQAAQTPAEHAHAAPPAPAKKAYQRKIFNDHQWRAVQVLCDLIIPADERSGS